MTSRILPATYRKLIATKLSTDFRAASEIVNTPLPKPGPNEILIKNRYVGIQATDVNFTAGRYDFLGKPPFDLGLEVVGEVVAAGEESKFDVNQPIGYIGNGCFSEYMLLSARHAMPMPEVKADYLSLMVSGLTAAIALDKVGEVKSKETVLVTAASGGTGQFAVQWAKHRGAHVIGTCSTDEKVEFLKSIGCDRPVNYKSESLFQVLRKEYKSGLDVVYESVGGDQFNAAMMNLKMHSRFVIIGFIGTYLEKAMEATSEMKSLKRLQPILITNSASIRGFYLMHFYKDYGQYMKQLIDLYSKGQLITKIDDGTASMGKPFVGLEAIPDAVEYLFTGRNQGKVIVEIPD